MSRRASDVEAHDAIRAVPSVEAVTAALGTVFDPELGMSVVELGLIYGIDVADGGAVEITMTLTAPGCPIHEVMAEWVRAAVRGVPGVDRVAVRLTFDPPWTPDRIHRHGGPRHGPPYPPDARSTPAKPGRSSTSADRFRA
jgi:metal-sulfur cluster biosynthetic enzyme